MTPHFPKNAPSEPTRIKTTGQFRPIVYAYRTPEIAKHDGMIKIGYTSKQTPQERINQQSGTVDVDCEIVWSGTAIFDDEDQTPFDDRAFHQYLIQSGVERVTKEWFRIDAQRAQQLFNEFRNGRGKLPTGETTPYELRAEQLRAVEGALARAQSPSIHKEKKYLWNAKPRFGKTLAVYDLIKRLNAQNALILTNRPAVANSWYSDYVQFLGSASGYAFVTQTDALKGKPYILNHEEFEEARQKSAQPMRQIAFVSLQDLKGAEAFGGDYVKLGTIATTHWDILIIDESHEGVETDKTSDAVERLKKDFTLYLSGTPFKALSRDLFEPDEVFTWSYSDEQRAKRDWKSMSCNPYETLPQLNLYVYQMSDIIRDTIDAGINIDDEELDYVFDLNEFFSTKESKDRVKRFKHEESVDKFLNALTTNEKYPYSTAELRAELRHSLWLLDRVDSALALADKLLRHPVFTEYEIVVAAGDGKFNDEQKRVENAFKRVSDAIRENEKTITLSVGQLTAGVTIPEWSAVLMLWNAKSPERYMQAAFRAQNPCVFRENGKSYLKERAYIFDFDPARTLTLYETFANDLDPNTVDGHGSQSQRNRNVLDTLNFFPVIGEDDAGEMILLDAEQILAIPRKIRSREVVETGFRSSFLFQNISNVFHGTQRVISLINNLPAVRESAKKSLELTEQTKDELSIDEDGDIQVPEQIVIGTAQNLKEAAKIFGDSQESVATLAEAIDRVQKKEHGKPTQQEQTYQQVKKIVERQIKEDYVAPIMHELDVQHGKSLKPKIKKATERKLNRYAEICASQAGASVAPKQMELETKKERELSAVTTENERAQVIRAHQQASEELLRQTMEDVRTKLSSYTQTIAQKIEEEKRKQEQVEIEQGVRDRLRGFSRTIPSFLMAYGSESTTLDNFDQIIPPEVFREVTGIELDDFRLLRDGGEEVNPNTGEKTHFKGKLFDPIVFDDSVKEFFKLKRKLARYFEDDSPRDIFDYIPPQRTNQIFTPKNVVQRMVDLLEQENPGCFDRDDQTFADLYMKSGLYIAEIVKRLYRNAEMKRRYPSAEERLRHIFAKQVYGLAPTEIIYRIAFNYILGFDENSAQITKHNLRRLDALVYAKSGTLQEKIDELFGTN
ncbi:MAG: DEAD/DEAH box helicase family protein [Planctomycetia bacterium]|nr:DEAD/DEAH box helicase family protein [Planctomycetia bacterium]